MRLVARPAGSASTARRWSWRTSIDGRRDLGVKRQRAGHRVLWPLPRHFSHRRAAMAGKMGKAGYRKGPPLHAPAQVAAGMERRAQGAHHMKGKVITEWSTRRDGVILIVTATRW